MIFLLYSLRACSDITNFVIVTARAVHKLRGHSKFRLILSGTPIQNCIEELFTLFEFIMVRF